jgi:hypothetical protein
MTYEIHAYFKDSKEATVLRTDDPDRAAEWAEIFNRNAGYRNVLVQIGHSLFSYSEFIKHLESAI